ncbi:MAG: TMEM175 family protein [Ktedonobacteraceae bacterium]
MQEAEDQQYGVSRLVAFSDGVFGFAITLLITSIPVPELPRSASADQIVQQLLGLLPNFYSYVFSFYMVGIYWMAHHRTFRYIIKFDPRCFCS